MRKFFKPNTEASKALLTTEKSCSEKDHNLKKNKKTKSLSPSSFFLNPFNNAESPRASVNCNTPPLNYLSTVSEYYKEYIEYIEIIIKEEKQKLLRPIRKVKSFQSLIPFGSFEKKTGSVEPIEQDKVREHIVIKFKNPTQLSKTEFSNITFDIKMIHKGQIGQDYKIVIEDHEQISHLDFTEINTKGFITVSGEQLSNVAKNSLPGSTIGL